MPLCRRKEYRSGMGRRGRRLIHEPEDLPMVREESVVMAKPRADAV